jgi:AraC family transcriptional regulator
VIEYIEAYLTEDLSLNDLATVAGLSQFHFSRIFKAALGLTPHQYLMKRRIIKSDRYSQTRFSEFNPSYLSVWVCRPISFYSNL